MSKPLRTSDATSRIERLLKIPAEPDPPAGSAGSVRVFRGAPGLYRYQLVVWTLKQIGAAGALAFGFVFLGAIPEFPYSYLLMYLEYFGVLSYLASMPATFLMVHLDYQLRWYIVTDRSLRIREGLVNISEKTMSFSNIQNIAVKQGPIQRFFGIADVEVRTAGGGSSGASHDGGSPDRHVGYFRGVDNAEEIRDAILDRVRRLRDSGLGDPDAESRRQVSHLDSPEAIASARSLLEEVRLLRDSFAAIRSGSVRST